MSKLTKFIKSPRAYLEDALINSMLKRVPGAPGKGMPVQAPPAPAPEAPAAKPAPAKPASAPRPAAKPVAKPAVKPAVKAPAAKPAPAAAKPAAKPAPKPAAVPAEPAGALKHRFLVVYSEDRPPLDSRLAPFEAEPRCALAFSPELAGMASASKRTVYLDCFAPGFFEASRAAFPWDFCIFVSAASGFSLSDLAAVDRACEGMDAVLPNAAVLCGGENEPGALPWDMSCTAFSASRCLAAGSAAKLFADYARGYAKWHVKTLALKARTPAFGEDARWVGARLEALRALLDGRHDAWDVVPRSIQRCAVVAMLHCARAFADRGFKIQPGEGRDFAREAKGILSLVSSSMIMDELPKYGWFYFKRLLMALRGSGAVCPDLVFSERWDPFRRAGIFRCFTESEGDDPEVSADGEAVQVQECKTIPHSLFGKVLLWEKRFRAVFPRHAANAEFTVGRRPAGFSSSGRTAPSMPLRVLDLGFLRAEHIHTPLFADSLYGSLLVMDREDRADDNGEHLCRWIMENHPEERVRFVLKRSSPDWARLDAEGFSLVDYGSPLHRKLTENCRCMISSHATAHIVDPFKNARPSRKFVFLQHGIILNDASYAFNNKQIDIFCTAANPEREMIAGSRSPWKFLPSECRLTGLPRHDRLWRLRETPPERRILVMPTWRSWLEGGIVEGCSREPGRGFADSEFARSWSSFLCGDFSRSLAEDGWEIIFFPHPNLMRHAADFAVPEWVQTKLYTECRVQDEILSASLVLTDYSSVAFDAAFIGRPAAYWMFDEEDFYARQYASGFSYRERGVGPVASTQEEFEGIVQSCLEGNGAMAPQWEERAEAFYGHRDDGACARVWNAVQELF